LRGDAPEGYFERVKGFVDEFPSRVDEYETLIDQNPIWRERTQGIGVISPDDCYQLGVSGPTLRGSGVAHDIRKAVPYSSFDQFRLWTEGFRPPAGEAYVPLESPKGEIGFYMVSNGGPYPWRMHERPPCFMNLQALSNMCEGRLIADVVAIIGSIDIVLGEIDR